MEEMKFKTGQEVLVRADKDCDWRYGLYSHFNKRNGLHCVGSAHWQYCIPYKDNEYLVGTNDMPKKENIEKKVINTIVEVLECDKNDITTDTNLFDDLGADSIDATEIMMKLEKVFNIHIEDEEVLYKTEYEKIGNICNYIKEQLNK